MEEVEDGVEDVYGARGVLQETCVAVLCTTRAFYLWAESQAELSLHWDTAGMEKERGVEEGLRRAVSCRCLTTSCFSC